MNTKSVALSGSGVIGQGWAVSFVAAGWDVTLYDISFDAARKAVDWVNETLQRLPSRSGSSGAISASKSLADAAKDARLVIESVPEDLVIKQAALAEIELVVSADCLIASSSSALMPSRLAAKMTRPERFVVAHPFNPSYLIPLVEVVPGRLTHSAVVDLIAAILTGIGKRVLRLNCEIEGFVGNRLQAAVVNEAMNLVRLGVASPADVEACLSECLALRWAFFGPFETMDMNANEGFKEYAEKFGRSYIELGGRLGVAVPWRAEDIATIDAYLRSRDTTMGAGDRFARRDAALLAIDRLKRDLAG